MRPLLLAMTLAGCAANNAVGPPPPNTARDTAAFLDTLEQRTFHYFWGLTNPQNGLTPDRAPSPSFSSIAAVGFALTAYPVGLGRGPGPPPSAWGGIRKVDSSPPIGSATTRG